MVANGFEGVPWMTGGGAKHSPNVGRVLGYAATGGGEGVVAPGDCKVVPSTTPNNQVHIGVGAIAIRNRYGAASSETYIARANEVSDLTIGSTGSTKRSDLIVAEIRDPQYGGQAPASAADGPYAYPIVVPGVPETTTSAQQISALLNRPVYALARIDVPANTTAITSGMIKELRELVAPRSRRRMFSDRASATVQTLEATDWVTWPGLTFQVTAPEWATHAELRVDISGIIMTAENADCEMRAHIGASHTSGPLILDNDAWANGVRHGTTLTDSGALIPSDRGALITCKVQARRTYVATSFGKYAVDASTHVGYDIQFEERVV